MSFIGGDDWMLRVQLLDSDNKPFDSQQIEIKWLLHNPSGEIVPHDFMITHVDAPNGHISIWIPAAETTKFVGGVWTDWIRIICNAITSTLMTGTINVTAIPGPRPLLSLLRRWRER